jgi:cell division protein FtsB
MLRNAIWLFVLSVIIFIVFLPSYTQMQDLKAKNAHQEKQILMLSQERDKLLNEKERLEIDPEYREKVAREEMGLIRKGETIYRFVPQD